MSRRVGAVCAGVLLVATVGCALNELRLPFGGPPSPHQVAAGRVEEVSTRLQAGLAEAGITVLTKFQGEELRMAGMTKGSKVFCLHLTREKPKGEEKEGRAEKTRVRLQWDREADEELWPTILRSLAAPEPG